MAHRVIMRRVALIMLMGATTSIIPARAGEVFGIWKANLIRSSEPNPKSLIVRFEPHAKGEVFTLDRVDMDGRSTTTSTILYLDNKPREFQGFNCSGTQSSRRLDSRTVEIMRTCSGGGWTRFVRRSSNQPKEMILEITDQQPDGRKTEQRLVLEKQL